MADVVIYTRQLCGYCAAAKRLLDRKGVAYTEHDATFEPELRAQMTRLTGGLTFPQVMIDGRAIGGSDDLHALERAGRLDALLGAAS